MTIVDRTVRLCCTAGSIEVMFSQYTQWSKLTYKQREEYVRLRQWGWEHDDAIIMAVDPYDD